MPDDFFAQEQKMATRALLTCYREAWQAIEQDTKIKPLIQKRPLTSIAVAAAGGLVAGYLLTPRRGRRPASPPPANLSPSAVRPEHHGLLVTLEKELASAIMPALRTLAVSTAGMVFSEMHQGKTNGKSSHEQGQDDPPQPRMQL